MGTIKDRKIKGITEAEDIKKRWQEYTGELYKKDLHDPDNHNGMIAHLRAREFVGTRLRLPLRLPRTSPHGDYSGAIVPRI